MKDYDKTKEFSYFKHWDVNSLYGRAESQKLPWIVSKCVKNISKFNEDFIKTYNEKGNQGYFL